MKCESLPAKKYVRRDGEEEKDGKTVKQTEKQTDRQTERQTDRTQKDKLSQIEPHNERG